jgi:hypothetical protein
MTQPIGGVLFDAIQNKRHFICQYVKFYLLLVDNNRIMSFQIFPNWCKKLGVAIFIVFSILGGYDDFLLGWHSVHQSDYEGPNTFANFFGAFMITVFNTLYMLGLLIYVLSKEKVEDDYIKLLRLESYQLTTIISIIISLVLYILSRNLEVTLDYFIILYIGLYLIIFSLKKRREI